MNIKNLTTEELVTELARRNKVVAKMPKPLVEPNFEKLIELCNDTLKQISDGDSTDNDYEYYIYEEAMQAIYGVDIFDWINDQII